MSIQLLANINMVTQNLLNSMIVPCIFAMAVYTGSIE
jgi:hypothetical protein